MSLTIRTADMKYKSTATGDYVGINSVQGNTIPATASDIGKALSPKTVENGFVTGWKFVSGGGGGSITVDTELDSTSENPVQNKAIYAVIGDIETLLASI